MEPTFVIPLSPAESLLLLRGYPPGTGFSVKKAIKLTLLELLFHKVLLAEKRTDHWGNCSPFVIRGPELKASGPKLTRENSGFA